MTASSVELDATATRRIQTSLALTMLGAVGGTCLLLTALVHFEPLKEWMRDTTWEQNRSRAILPMYAFNGHYTDYEEWFLHEELPSSDFSRGGVYFLGASSMKWALKPWDLPAETRPLIHNFAFGGTRHSDQADFLRYLVEQQDFLKAGPEKTLVVFGINYRLVHHGRLPPNDKPSDMIRSAYIRHGFYTMESDGTIHRTPRNALTENLVLEPARWTGFLREFANLIYTVFKAKRVHTPDFYNSNWAFALRSDWNEMMDAELAHLKKAFVYMKERKAKVAVVLFPMQTWDAKLPYQAAYVEKLRKICDAEGVEIHDFSKSMDDEDFGDSDHLNSNGIEKFQRALMGLCLDHLHSSGVLPSKDAPKGP